MGTIAEVLEGGDEVQVTGFGKFYIQERKAREGVNLQTGEKMRIPASKVPAFSVGNALKKAVESCDRAPTTSARLLADEFVIYPA
jgi:DNA-binding protein HU-beta